MKQNMKEYVSRKYVQLGLVVVGCLILTVAGIAGLLRARATVANSYTKESAKSPSGLGGNPNLSGVSPADSQLDDLIDRSSAIVVGTVMSNICRLSADKEDVNTYYTVRIDEVLSGDLRQDNTVVVSMPGGLVMFRPDGSEVSEKNQLKTLREPITVEGSDKIVPQGAASSKFTPPSGDPLVNDKTYALFLSEDPDAKRGFILTELSSPQSSYALPDEKARAELVDNIRQALARAPALEHEGLWQRRQFRATSKAAYRN
jgi:hypothetical protein